MRTWPHIALYSSLACLAATPSLAASLQVMPIVFEMSAAKPADQLTLTNTGTAPMTAQARVYKWSHDGKEEKFEPATDVVASPPMLQLAAGASQIVRIVRVSKAPIEGEESYRILVDEVPDKAQPSKDQINFVFKHSIPVFISNDKNRASHLTWAVEKQDGRTFLVAHNDGNRRARIGGLTVKPANGKEISLGKGLSGYVLAGSTMRWMLPLNAAIGNVGMVSVTARSDEGPINATAQAQASAR